MGTTPTAHPLLDAAGRRTTDIGLGCMGMSWGYAESQRDDRRSTQVIHAALDAGVRLIDTADVYGDGHNERLVGAALRGRSEDTVVATKGGLVVDDLARRDMHRDGSPAHLRAAVEASLTRLGVEAIDLYYLHRIDTAVPLEDSWGELSLLVAEGKLRALGLSEVTAAEAGRAHAVHPVAAVQSELSLWTRDPLDPHTGTLRWCADHGAAFVPYAPLGRGFLTGAYTPDSYEQGDFRATSPRFAGLAHEANLRIVEATRQVAGRNGATPAQVALAWTLAQGAHVIPVPGTKNPGYLKENLESADLALDSDDLALLDAVPAAVGSRY
ncbi:aldo/keto reductase [Streptomyces sp. NBC_00483]|uniref:aldo/keto reductase n=1 Tax=Streptomyces sp. NBC_00483 TaxID=2975756 RepID=UPI002E19BED1